MEPRQVSENKGALESDVLSVLSPLPLYSQGQHCEGQRSKHFRLCVSYRLRYTVFSSLNRFVCVSTKLYF